LDNENKTYKKDMKFKKNSSLNGIKLLICDVDGTLTDGGMYYSKNGEEMKKFNTKDAFGIEILEKIGISTILLTRENSLIVKQRAKKIKIKKLISGCENKISAVEKLTQRYGIKFNQIAYVGDDLNDYNVMKNVGFSACPSDANYQIKKISKYVCDSKGGDGAVREVIDYILINKKIKLKDVIKIL